MTPDEFDELSALASHLLCELADEDWSLPAKNLEWTCRQTVDQIIDCVFSYTMQVAVRAESGFLPFSELHANAEASNRDLIDGLRAVEQMFHDVVQNAPSGTVASDGVVSLDLGDWCARAAYEIALHTYDVAMGLGVTWEVPSICARRSPLRRPCGCSTARLWPAEAILGGCFPLTRGALSAGERRRADCPQTPGGDANCGRGTLPPGAKRCRPRVVSRRHRGGRLTGRAGRTMLHREVRQLHGMRRRDTDSAVAARPEHFVSEERATSVTPG